MQAERILEVFARVFSVEGSIRVTNRAELGPDRLRVCTRYLDEFEWEALWPSIQIEHLYPI